MATMASQDGQPRHAASFHFRAIAGHPVQLPGGPADPGLELAPVFEAPVPPQVEPAVPPPAAALELVPRPAPAARLVRPCCADAAGALTAPALPDCPKHAVERRSLPSWGGWLPVQPATPVTAFTRQVAAMEPRASGPGAAQRLPTLAGVEPMADLAFEAPEMALAAEKPPEEVYPVAGFLALEYYSQRIRGSASIELRSIAGPRMPVQLPGMRLEPLAVRPGDLVPVKPARKPPAKVRAMAARAKPVTRARPWWHGAGAIAAGVFMGLFAWGGASLLRNGWTSRPVKPDLFAPAVSLDASNPPAPSNRAMVATRAPAAKGPTAWARNAVAKRATVEFIDAFRNGMSAWGERPSTWAPGWSKNPDGYVRPGQLALFSPSLAYSNYRMDFFTQIESKSVGWVVRARDRKNYYAMKFRVVEPGLRPIIAMVHVTVLGGKPGREVEIPLSVMVHNNEPYHVAVEVKGNRMVTSIEGQEIDTFTDNTLPSGGVGFFADAGEKARLYWLRVTANDDFVGRLCAYVSTALGQASPAAARLQPGEAPMGAPGPGGPPAEIALGAALGFQKNRTRQPWA
jgi:hypothetical protein